MRLLVLLVLLCGCTTVDYVKVRYVVVEPAALPRACPRIIGTYGGCAMKRGDIWEIYAPQPRDVLDSGAMAVLGHEFYCHAWLGKGHYDEKGVRLEPWRDCVPEGGKTNNKE